MTQNFRIKNIRNIYSGIENLSVKKTWVKESLSITEGVYHRNHLHAQRNLRGSNDTFIAQRKRKQYFK